MDSDTEDDQASLSVVRKNLREIANSRPGTNVAKAIIAYEEAPCLSTLELLLEEVSKNTDFSTDLRLSLSYYMNEFLHRVMSPSVSCPTLFTITGKVLQYCGKIYADRVELVYQAVEQQIEALLIADPKKADNSDNNNGNKNKEREKPAKRRTKKLVQTQLNPHTFRMNVKTPTSMSMEHRVNHDDFESLSNVNYTIEYMYQDHTPAKLWANEPMIDPDNPLEQDEKKNYKLYTYHPEHRYNTLLPDIPFERLNMIKDYVNNNRLDVSELLNENMTNREYLYHYIELENKMLASRYGNKSGQKRAIGCEDDVQAKRRRIDDQLDAENVNKRLLENAEESPSKRRHTDAVEGDEQINNNPTLHTQISVDSVLSEPLNSLALADKTDVDLNDSQMSEPILSSTLLGNEQSQVESQLNLSDSKELQLDSGLGQDDSMAIVPTAAAAFIKYCAGQSFDDEGVVLADNIDEQRLQSLSPRVMVRDILPGVPDKTNLSIRIDSEMLALSGIHELLEETVKGVTNLSVHDDEIMKVPRAIRYPIELNFFLFPKKKLRSNCLFKLPKDFDNFKDSRLPAKRIKEPKKPSTSRVAALSTPGSVDAQMELEFDSEQNFLGFRRATYDSGFDYEEPRAESAYLACDENIILDVGTADPALPEEIEANEEPREGSALPPCDDNIIVDAANNESLLPTLDTADEIQAARASHETEEDVALPETLGEPLDTTVMHETATTDALLGVEEDDLVFVNNQTDSEIDFSAMQVDISVPDLQGSSLGEDSSEETSVIIKNPTIIDAATNARIVDWHRRLAPTLAAAHERQNFSIQDLNTEIIRKCQEKEGEATLADVLEDKDPTKLCCYMLSSLLLTNQGNVKLQIDTMDKNKPIEMHQFKMKLLSTERKQLNPEDDIGNMRSNNTSPGAPKTTKPVQPNRGKACYELVDNIEPVNVKTVHLIKPVPKATSRPDDADSGISSLPASLVSGTSLDT